LWGRVLVWVEWVTVFIIAVKLHFTQPRYLSGSIRPADLYQ